MLRRQTKTGSYPNSLTTLKLFCLYILYFILIRSIAELWQLIYFYVWTESKILFLFQKQNFQQPIPGVILDMRCIIKLSFIWLHI